MIRAFKKQLRQISEQDGARFASTLRERSAVEMRDDRIATLRSLVMTMPDLLDFAWILAVSPNTPSRVKALNSFAMTYLYHPRDLLPESELGLLGYLDDAYLVASTVRRSVAYVPFESRRWSQQFEEILRQLPGWLELARNALPVETGKLDAMLDDLEEGKTELFDAILASA